MMWSFICMRFDFIRWTTVKEFRPERKKVRKLKLQKRFFFPKFRLHFCSEAVMKIVKIHFFACPDVFRMVPNWNNFIAKEDRVVFRAKFEFLQQEANLPKTSSLPQNLIKGIFLGIQKAWTIESIQVPYRNDGSWAGFYRRSFRSACWRQLKHIGNFPTETCSAAIISVRNLYVFNSLGLLGPRIYFFDENLR